MEYKFAVGFQMQGSPQAIGKAIENVRVQKGGQFATRDIVREAKKAQSPLHPLFEWNNRKAAEKYRLRQAQYVVSAIVAAPEDDEDFEPVRAFVCLTDTRPGAGVYTSVQAAVQDRKSSDFIIQQAKDEIAAWRRRYRALEAFSQLFNVIDSMAE